MKIKEDSNNFIILYDGELKLATNNPNEIEYKKLIINNYKDYDCDNENCSCTMVCVAKAALLNNYNSITITNESESSIFVHIEYLGLVIYNNE